MPSRPKALVRSVKYGSLYTAGQGDDRLNILHLWGTPAQMGDAHGTLLREEISKLMPNVWGYFVSQVEQGEPKWVHPEMKKWVAEFGLEAALDMQYAASELYIDPQYVEELRALSKASTVPWHTLRNVHMIGELTRGACSMFGAWGQAVAAQNTSMLAMRALDWDTGAGLQQVPLVTIYHYGGGAHSFANLGWAGWIGVLTGVNQAKMTSHEIGVSFPDDTFGEEARFGNPFVFVQRDMLQKSGSIDQTIQLLQDTKRTCNLILGAGDGKVPTFRGFQYDTSVLRVVNSSHPLPAADWHAPLPDTVYWGMDWLCPSYTQALHDRLQAYQGKLTAELAVRQVNAIVQTGDLHVGIMDLGNDHFYVANARAQGEQGPLKAFDRAYIRVDLAAAWREQPQPQHQE